MSPLDYQLPPSLSKVAAIRRIYPDLYRRELHGRRRGGDLRQGPDRFVSWEHLRRAARNRYVRQHPGTPAAVTFSVKHGGSIRAAFRAVWNRYEIPQWRQRRLECIVEHEGGFDRMDRWYGPGLDYHGWMNGRFKGATRPVGPGQIQAFHARLTHPEVRDYYVTERTFAILTNPFDHARTMVLVGDHAYATLGACS